MQHPSHKHPLILNEIYEAKEGDVCYGCNEQIFSCKLFVYSCTCNCVGFLLHKSCAELPARIEDPRNQKQFLFLHSRPYHYSWNYIDPSDVCIICGMQCEWWFIYGNDLFDPTDFVCVKCVMFRVQSLEDRKFEHPAHSQHPLTLVQHLASFKCYACKVVDNIRDLSYICTQCPLWMHKNCAHAPTSFHFQFHNKHPLTLSFSLPQVYQKFKQYCNLCNKKLNKIDWLYYCPKCRFFAHFHCARSNRKLSSSENEVFDSDVVHLPAADESSLNLLLEQFVKTWSTLNHNNNNSICSATKGIKHWTHDEHDLQLITINELNDRKYDDDETLFLCDGCVKPIRTDGDLFYGCVSCKYILHKVCAELPKDIRHQLWRCTTFSAHKYNEPYKFFQCGGCRYLCNGIYFSSGSLIKLDIGCLTLPKIIKHETHPHQLNQVLIQEYCKTCGSYFCGLKFCCEKCNFYMCGECIMKTRTLKHPWDPHPLHLIYEAGMVSDDHEHEFECEFCSKVIDTNFWFYHCSDCDLSFHIEDCLETSSFLHYPKIKIRATDQFIIAELHPHSLKFVLNKKFRHCQKCGQTQLGYQVLQCTPCKAVFCLSCCDELKYY